MAEYKAIDFVVESNDKLISPKDEKMDKEIAMALSIDMGEMVQNCNSSKELFNLATKYFKDRPGVMDDDVKEPRLQAHRTVIQHRLFMILMNMGKLIGFGPADVNLKLEWEEAGCDISFGINKNLSDKKKKIIGKMLDTAFSEEVDEINKAFGDGEEEDTEIDNEVSKALNAIGWDKQLKGEA